MSCVHFGTYSIEIAIGTWPSQSYRYSSSSPILAYNSKLLSILKIIEIIVGYMIDFTLVLSTRLLGAIVFIRTLEPYMLIGIALRVNPTGLYQYFYAQRTETSSFGRVNPTGFWAICLLC